MKSYTRMRIAVIVSLLCLWGPSAFAVELPDTGQSTCYDPAGGTITCPPPEDPGAQDGSYNHYPLSYTDNGDGTVADDNTGLVWQKEDDGSARWQGGAIAYCDALNLAGHSDWRLPSKKELITIVDYGTSSPPAIDTQYFSNTKTLQPYWTSTSAADNAANAWTFDFYMSASQIAAKSLLGFARCVRGAQMTFGNFIGNADGTVTDRDTGLVWQEVDGGSKHWSAALSYCEELSLGDHTDWRLPNIKELETINDDARVSPSIDTQVFPAATSGNYWSSTTWYYPPHTEALGVDFSSGNGLIFFGVKATDNYNTRCVREDCSIAFTDVPGKYWSHKFIKAIACRGITAGCGNNDFCPEDSVTRAQMAVFLTAALKEQPAASCTGMFQDVNGGTVGDGPCRFIEKFASLGITAGCGNGNFCPNDPVTRAQMAVFMTTALHQAPAGVCNGTFADAGASDVGEGFCRFIEKFATLGITAGCGGGNYCPHSPVSRAQMAVFLTIGFLQ